MIAGEVKHVVDSRGSPIKTRSSAIDPSTKSTAGCSGTLLMSAESRSSTITRRRGAAPSKPHQARSRRRTEHHRRRRMLLSVNAAAPHSRGLPGAQMGVAALHSVFF